MAKKTKTAKLKYQTGFGNYFEMEALNSALPQGRNSPQKVSYGLYAEQFSGSAFTMAQNENERSWLYRIRPSVLHSEFKPLSSKTKSLENAVATPNQMRWSPLASPSKQTDFIDGMIPWVFNGSSENQTGCTVYLYACNSSMKNRYFYNSDGEFLIVPQMGALHLRTEMGELHCAPGEITVIPRGLKFQVLLLDNEARGYICENHGKNFRLPDLGPIGANGLANPRDFLYPVAAYEDKKGSFELITKFASELWSAKIDHSPLNVVAWHGNYAPYKYDLARYNVMNTVSFDHADPSIFTVLTSPSYQPGMANVDFVIFPPRWSVAENTFRPPYYHRNIMSEFMGLIHGTYDAKEKGFVPGGSSLHNCMSAHGPEAEVFEKASQADLKPAYMANTLAIMFESRYAFKVTSSAMNSKSLQKDYIKCWQGLKSHFKKKR